MYSNINKLAIFINQQDNMDSNGKNTRSQNNRKLTLRSLKDEYNLNNENKNLTESISNVRSNLNTKKIFNISDDIIPVQVHIYF